MINRFVDFFSSARIKRDGEKEPSFKDALQGIDIKDIFIVSKFSKNQYLKFKANLALKEFKKIMEVEVL